MGQASATLPAADSAGDRRTLRLMERQNQGETQGSITFTVKHHSDMTATQEYMAILFTGINQLFFIAIL